MTTVNNTDDQVKLAASRVSNIAATASNAVQKPTDKEPAATTKPTPTTIFAGMTKAESISYNLQDQYEAANTDGQEGISQSEYNEFNNNINQLNNNYGISGSSALSVIKRAAKSGKDLALAYNDYLGSIREAQFKVADERMDIPAQDDQNGKVVAKTLTQKEIEKALELAKHPPQVHENMTRAEAKKKGLLKDFEAVAKGKDIVTADDIKAYQIEQLRAIGFTRENVNKTINTASKENKIKLAEQIINMKADPSMVSEDFDFVKTMDELKGALCINQSEWDALDKDAQGKLIGQRFLERLDNDLDPKNLAGRLVFEKDRLKTGKFSESEKAHGWRDGDKIEDEEQLMKMAMAAVVQSYISDIAFVCKQIAKNGSDEEKEQVIGGVIDALKETPQFRQMLEAFGIESIDDDKIKQDVIAMVIENEKDSTDAESVGGNMLASTVISNANEENLTTFFTYNSEQIDTLTNIASDVLSVMPDGAAKETLQNFITNVAPTIAQTNNAEASDRAPANWSSDARMWEVNQRKNESLELYFTDQQNYVEETPQERAKGDFFAQMTSSLGSPEVRQTNKEADIEHVKKAMEKAKNMSMAGALSFLLKECPPEFMPTFEAKIRGIAKPILVDAYVNGDDNLRKLLKSLQQIHTPDIIAYFDNKPSELNNVSIQVKFEYMKAKSEQWTHMSANDKAKEDKDNLPYPIQKKLD